MNSSWLVNLSEKEIPNDVIEITSLGRGYSLPTKCSRKDVLKTLKNVENLCCISISIQKIKIIYVKK